MFRFSLTAAVAIAAFCTVGQANAWQGPYPAPRMQRAQMVPPGPIQQYPNLNAPLYPSPRQDIPQHVGGTMITNPAFAPHEMLYEHDYHGVYAPYYYRVKGHWLWTPFGIESHDKWELMGTDVKVKYRSKFGLFSNFTPPYSP